MAPQAHTSREYDHELETLREQILLMGARVEEMIQKSMIALVRRDPLLASQTIISDRRVDQMEVEIDRLCLRILATRQPVASDLRVITTAMKMVTDLERMGDLAVSICERAIELSREPPFKPYVDIPRMASQVEQMIRKALDAFVARDPSDATAVLEMDGEVDALNAQVFRELLTYMIEDPKLISRATRIQSIAKHLERMGDHAKNLAEMVVFMVKGEDIRHLPHG